MLRPLQAEASSASASSFKHGQMRLIIHQYHSLSRRAPLISSLAASTCNVQATWRRSRCGRGSLPKLKGQMLAGRPLVPCQMKDDCVPERPRSTSPYQGRHSDTRPVSPVCLQTGSCSRVARHLIVVAEQNIGALERAVVQTGASSATSGESRPACASIPLPRATASVCFPFVYE